MNAIEHEILREIQRLDGEAQQRVLSYARALGQAVLTPPLLDAQTWHEFLIEMYGSFADEPLERPSQLPLEIRDALE